MHRGTEEEATGAASPEEIQRRVSEYRRIGFERRIPAQVVYHEANHPCPWPGCGLRIAAVHFQLEQLGDPSQTSSWLDAWWKGPGLVARCPGCSRYVLFDLEEKRTVTDPASLEHAVLPDDWQHKAHIVLRPA